MYKLDFEKSRKYIYRFLRFLISRNDLIIKKNNHYYKTISINDSIDYDYLYEEFSSKKYYLGNYRIVNWEWLEELCYYNYNSISDFSIIK